MSPKYPLEAVRTLRQARTDEAAGELGARRARVRAAESACERAARELAQAKADLARLDGEQRGRLDAGLERAGDLARADAARRAELERVARLGSERDRLDKSARAAEQARVAAARELESALSLLQAVDEHREHWSKAVAAADEQREDEAAAERWNAERFGRGRP